MNIKHMRLIDELCGVPICAVLSLFARHSQADVRRLRMAEAPKLLIVHLSEMGAFVLAQPAIQELKRRLPNAELYFLVFSPIDDLIRELKLVPDSHIFAINKNSFGRLTLSSLRSLYRLRRLKMDAVINEEGFSRFAAILSYMSCPNGMRVGVYPYGIRSLYKGELETHRVQYNDHIHASRSYLNLVRALWADPHDLPLLKEAIAGSGQADATPVPGSCPSVWNNYLPLPYDFDYQPKAEDLAKIDSALRRQGAAEGQELIIVNPNSSDMLPHRRWPLENYEAVCGEIFRRHPQAAIVITGVAQETEGAKYLRAHVSGPIIDLTGNTTMGELLALYTRCRMMITNDSGPAHFASIVGLPTVVLYGPETPLLFSPLGDKCRQLYANVACSPCVSPYNNKDTACRRNNCCMSCLTPEHVLQAVEKVWQMER